MAPRFVGLDLETTASDLARGARICQVGIAFGAWVTWGEDVRCDPRACLVEPEALKVNEFTEERLLAGEPPEEHDIRCAAWLEQHAPGERLVAVGWNVAGFDVPFVRMQQPLTAAHFHYRTVDLNAICFALDGRGGHNWEWWKREGKRAAEQVLGAPRWHNAEFDAAAGLVTFWWLKGVLHGER